jgi:cation diffusion facilitator family transporter
MAKESTRAVVAAFLGNAALTGLKAAAAVFTGSAAMLAETFHSAADTGNQVLLFLGLRLAERQPDRRHPFGYSRNVYFWAFVVSMLLFSVGGAFSIWDAVGTLRHPRPHERPGWAYGVLAGALLFELSSFVVAVRAARSEKREATFLEYLREARDPTVVTVILEDSAALVSILIAGAGVSLTHLTGDPVWDAAASGTIGLLLITVAVFLGIENHSLLIGEAAPPRVVRAIQRLVVDDDAVVQLLDLRTMHLGPDAILVVLGLKFRDDLCIPAVEAAVDRLQQSIQAELGPVTSDALIVIEPMRTGQRAVGRAA